MSEVFDPNKKHSACTALYSIIQSLVNTVTGGPAALFQLVLSQFKTIFASLRPE